MKEADRYLKIVQWSDEDHCYVGTCPGLMLGGVHGDDELQVYAQLSRVVEEWIAIQHQDQETLPRATARRKYSGKFVLRTGEQIHEALAIEALRAGESLNSFCLKHLKKAVAQHTDRAT